MIGFDRPIRPRWIYDSLLLATPGQKLTELKHPFEEIACELTGKEGKRKVRTVLFRYFLRDFTDKTRVRDKLRLKDISEQHDLAFMTPIYLFYLIGSTDTLITISEHIFRLYEWGSEINQAFLKRKMVEGAGDRDVVVRAAGSFLKTLMYFAVITGSDGKLMLNKPLIINEEQAAIMLQLWAKELNHTSQIDLSQLPASIFSWFLWPDLRTVSRRYNGELWDYQHRIGGEYLSIYNAI